MVAASQLKTDISGDDHTQLSQSCLAMPLREREREVQSVLSHSSVRYDNCKLYHSLPTSLYLCPMSYVNEVKTALRQNYPSFNHYYDNIKK